MQSWDISARSVVVVALTYLILSSGLVTRFAHAQGEDQPLTRSVRDGDLQALLESFSIPPIDQVKRDPVAAFKPSPDAKHKRDEYRSVLDAVELVISKEFPDLKLKKAYLSPSPQFSKDHLHVLFYSGRRQADIYLQFCKTPKEAGERIRALEVSSGEPYKKVRECGDEAYQYGKSGTFLMCFSNLYVMVNGDSRKTKEQVGKAIDRALKSLVNDID